MTLLNTVSNCIYRCKLEYVPVNVILWLDGESRLDFINIYGHDFKRRPDNVLKMSVFCIQGRTLHKESL